MARYIDAEIALKELLHDRISGMTEYNAGITQARATIRSIPTADVQEVRHGKWEVFHVDVSPHSFRMIKCGYCRFFIPTLYLDVSKYRYCPNCGAIMDGEENKNVN